MTWHPGDPVGTGRVYLPDAETRRQYGEACRTEIEKCKERREIERQAREAVAAGEPKAIRQRIDKVPEHMREAVRDRAREIWREGETNDTTENENLDRR
jgi:hypothetical protein